MKYHNHKSQTHPLHEDIKPIVSALKYGKRRIAVGRFEKLCNKLDLVRWETLVVADMVRASCNKQGIALN